MNSTQEIMFLRSQNYILIVTNGDKSIVITCIYLGELKQSTLPDCSVGYEADLVAFSTSTSTYLLSSTITYKVVPPLEKKIAK